MTTTEAGGIQMSELKSVYIDQTGDWVRSGNDTGKFYLKEEVDKVIENRDKEIANLKDSIGKLLKSKTEQVVDEVFKRCLIYGEGFVPVEHAMRLVAELRHHKYKRCLWTAMWCKSNSEMYNEFAADASEYMPSYEARFRRNATLYQKWAMRWMELAEKFKETK